jgi:hypothetical protein
MYYGLLILQWLLRAIGIITVGGFIIFAHWVVFSSVLNILVFTTVNPYADVVLILLLPILVVLDVLLASLIGDYLQEV